MRTAVGVGSDFSGHLFGDQVEALAFAWLARRSKRRETGSIPAVTGARGARILGAIYPR